MSTSTLGPIYMIAEQVAPDTDKPWRITRTKFDYEHAVVLTKLVDGPFATKEEAEAILKEKYSI